MFNIPADIRAFLYRIERNVVKFLFILFIVNLLVNSEELACFVGSKS